MMTASPVQAGKCFNDYQRWFAGLRRTDSGIDVTLTLRVRAFGSEQHKQAAWDRDWRARNPHWGPATAGVSVSSQPPEIWCDLRMDGEGNLIIPPHVIGHELIHALALVDPRITDPDRFIMEEIY